MNDSIYSVMAEHEEIYTIVLKNDASVTENEIFTALKKECRIHGIFDIIAYKKLS